MTHASEFSSDESADLLYGVPAIARHLRLGDRQVYHLIDKGDVPAFKIGGRVCARRSTIAAWLENLEKEAINDTRK